MSDDKVYVFEVTEKSFNSAVVITSHTIPVVVEFMNVWSEPCIRLEECVLDLVKEFSRQFIFVKADIDEQPGLKEEYGIRNSPTLKIFHNGNVVYTKEGAVQENEIRDVLKGFGIYRKSDEIRMDARQKHINGETVEAINLLTQAIQQDPKNTRVAMDMVQIFLDIKELAQAKDLFNKLPDSDKSSEMGKSLIGQITFLDLAGKTDGKEALQQKIEVSVDDFDAHFDLSVCLVAEHDYQLAMDHLFAILEKQPDYKDGAAREMIINLINMLAPNDPELAQDFRRRLGSVLI
ncbi:MAG: tetratricopeptide repeat protein [Gammaproteobacteria bacterium]|nr:tetratricopeptide repeat protein [Gammaproteobacteria bacterium]